MLLAIISLAGKGGEGHVSAAVGLLSLPQPFFLGAKPKKPERANSASSSEWKENA